jgi:hypothetical protein
MLVDGFQTPERPRGLAVTKGAAPLILLAMACLAAPAARADVVYSTPGATYSQDFDSLSTSGFSNAWTNDSTLAGWSLFNVAGEAITSYAASSGSGVNGSFYSYGSAANTDRALGGVGSNATYFGTPANGAVAGWITLAIKNSTGLTLGSAAVSFNGEQWRDGGNTTPVAQTMVLQYGFGDAFADVATWLTPGGDFNWASPVFTSSSGPVDGNGAGRVAGRGGPLQDLNWQNGSTLWLRWVERNDSNSDHGLAIDDLSFSAVAVPEASAFLFGGIVCGLAGLRTCWQRRQRRQSIT